MAAKFSSGGGLQVADGIPDLPLEDRGADLVVCLESFSHRPASERRELAAEAWRVLQPNGVFAVRVAHGEDAALGEVTDADFWTIEDELRGRFQAVHIIAQIPWRGFSMAPVIDEPTSRNPDLRLHEELLAEPAEASYYLLLACRGRPPVGLAEQCLLIPTSGDAERQHSREYVRQTRRQADEETRRLQEQVEQAQRELAVAQDELSNRHARVDALQRELDERGKHADVSQRKLAAKTEQLAEVSERLRELEASIDRARGDASVQAQEEHQRLIEARAHAVDQAEEARDALAKAQTEIESLRSARDQAQARLQLLTDDLSTVQENVRTRDTDLAVLTRTVAERDKAFERLGQVLEARTQEVRDRGGEVAQLRNRCEQLAAEREELSRQVEVGIAEREGTRQLANRVEAELELARKRIASQERELADRTQEASRLTGEVEALRERLSHQETALQQTQSRAEELSASAAQGVEQGRMLADVAVDRDRLRDELGRRSQELQALEERLWQVREDLQKERLELVRMSGQLEQAKEELNRSRVAEKDSAAEVERLNKELRDLELAHRELQELLRSRGEAIARLERDTQVLSSESEDLQTVRTELAERGKLISDLRDELSQLRAREENATELARKRSAQLEQVGKDLLTLRSNADDNAKLAARLQNELDVRELEVEQLAASVTDLQQQFDEHRTSEIEAEQERSDLQSRLEEAASEGEMLRRRLRERDQELDEVVAARETSGVELYKLRKELEAASNANEQLEQALKIQQGDAEVEELPDVEEPNADWPTDAVAAIRRLRAQLAAQARRHAEQMAQREQLDTTLAAGERGRIRRLQLEIAIRAEEQEHVLGRLDEAEQHIWEMGDAADRNAARLAAGLAQLEQHKEVLDEAKEELEVTRSLLAAEQTRAVEQERLLASERAKLARAGIGADGLPANVGPATSDVEEVFTDLSGSRADLLDLSLQSVEPETEEPGVVHEVRGGSGSGIVVETLEDDASEWPDDASGGDSSTAGSS